MKKILLTFVALLAFTASVCAQKYHAQESRNRTVVDYAWGKGYVQEFNLSRNGKNCGKVLVRVNANKSISFTNNSPYSVSFHCYIRRKYAPNPEGSTGGARRLENSIAAGKTYVCNYMTESINPINELYVREFVVTNMR